MIIVSNTSPIFYLSTIGQLDLLHQLYDEIVIPITVFQEITNVGNTVVCRVGSVLCPNIAKVHLPQMRIDVSVANID